MVPNTLLSSTSLLSLWLMVGGKVLPQFPHGAQNGSTASTPVVSPLTWSTLALMAGPHMLTELGEGGKVLGTMPAADWKNGVTLAAGVHLLLRNRIGGVRDVVLVVNLEHLDRRLCHLVLG